MFCRGCGKQVAKEELFCGECGMATGEPKAAEAPAPKITAPKSDQKYCSVCGKLIMLQAEICPNCGCRQAAAPSVINFDHLVGDPIIGPMLLLCICNFLWAGLGNLVIGDNLGWKYGFVTWLPALLVVVIGPFAAIPCFLYGIYCDYQGYQYLLHKQQQAPVTETPSTCS